MAKETKSERSKAGKRAWNKRVAKARAEGKTRLKVGKHFVPIGGKGKKPKGLSKTLRKGIKRERARRAGQGAALARATRRAKPRTTRRAAPKVKHIHHKGKTVTKLRTIQVKVPGKTKRVLVTAAGEKRGRRRGHRRAREGYAMENPLSTMEIISGGLTMLLGLAVADVSDRYWATNALTASAAASSTGAATYTDTPQGTAGTAPTTYFGTGLYPGMLNGAAVIAPMNMTRWVSGGVLAAVPFLAAAYTKQPTTRTALQLFGFGVIARIGGKALVDLFAGLLGSTQLGQQLYVNELAATGQYQAAMGNPVTVTLPSPGQNPPAAGGPSGSASGLGRGLPGNQPCCAACAQGRPCTQTAPPPPPQATYAPETTVSQAIASLMPGSTVPTAAYAPPSAPVPVTTPAPPVGAGRAPNPFAWSNHLVGDVPARIH